LSDLRNARAVAAGVWPDWRHHLRAGSNRTCRSARARFGDIQIAIGSKTKSALIVEPRRYASWANDRDGVTFVTIGGCMILSGGCGAMVNERPYQREREIAAATDKRVLPLRVHAHIVRARRPRNRE
jgi:hypothetical protein